MKLSIITINLNNVEGLKKTAVSIAEQTFQDFEWIIIDGGSTDGSVEAMSEYDGIISFMVSEKDSGIYNAMNKGVSRASGDYLLFLNSGDCLSGPNVLESVFREQFAEDIIYGDLLTEDNFGVIKEMKYEDTLSFHSLYRFSLPHPSSFIARHLLLKYPYDERYRIVSDKEFYIKMALRGYSFRHISCFVSIFDNSGISSCNPQKVLEEDLKMRNAIIPSCIRVDYSEGRIGSLIELRRKYRIFGKFITFCIIVMEKLDGWL